MQAAADRPAPPALGADVRDEWLLDWSMLTVNHGSYGATPRVVLAAQDAWRRRMEEQPSAFMRRTLPDALRASAERLAGFVGAEGRDLVFVDNATVGCNAVLRSLDLGPGDEILLLDHAYRAVSNSARFVADKAGASLVVANIPFPRPEPDAVVAALGAAVTPNTRLVILDHITSPSALVLPIERLVAACQVAGVPVLVDGAHAPGQVSLDVPALGADWYVGNCHKWLMAPKGCGFLWSRRDRQANLHPVTISHGLGKGYLAEFDWTGTRDPSAFLAVDAAIDFHERLGGAGLRARNAALAEAAGELLAERLGTDVAAAPPMRGSMAAVRLPLLGPATMERAMILRHRLLEEYGTDAALHPIDGAFWVRVSAQAYNTLDDYERLAAICLALVRTDRSGD